MSIQEVIDVARNFAVMVRIQGPDPKGLKMRKHAFHLYNSGRTTLSASGMLLPSSLVNASVAKQNVGEGNLQSMGGYVLVMTVASVIEPFLSQQHRDNMSKLDKPTLIPGAQIDILTEGKEAYATENKEVLHWLPAELLKLVDVATSSTAVQSLIEASSGSNGSIEHGWEVGWSLASYGSGHQSFMDSARKQVEQASFPSQTYTVVAESSNPSLMGKSTTRVAILRVSSTEYEGLPEIGTSHFNKRGDLLLSIGSPFGILSPIHFFNSVSVGSVANIYPSSNSQRSLLMADIRCLPGMEGSPVFGKHAELIGILSRPLRQRTSAAEIQMVIPWEAIASACSDMLEKQPQNTWNGINHDNGFLSAVGMGTEGGSIKDIHGYLCAGPPPSSSIDKATASICLITVDDGAWASGILLNKQGLILTNAHLLEPWRFGKASANGEVPKTKPKVVFTPYDQCKHPGDKKVSINSRDQGLPQTGMEPVDFSLKRRHKGFRVNPERSGNRNIRVRLDFMDPWIWTNAKVVHVSKGPLDVALLQLEIVPDQLCPVVMDFTCPSPGSKAYILGHGLFGPRCDFLPSACLGVIAKVVEAKRSMHYQSTQQTYFPAMLQTTAAVHPGGSGGAVVNSDGRMIGLVTR
ncbi:PREDICTED: glyoxysomal processing protease, glyoxysomal isoform X2 [Ipomoea nil]|uniref:glyoxysomal processing protease, glyoxysomal isoform X2 n=1 Tax=Ipomoea nil TaxID=35883 RepID=UPI00090094D4|nr:PREDICTED: glyoxysomal processing protease, glyoxysomal isoform X2 [Ipomoea nil]